MERNVNEMEREEREMFIGAIESKKSGKKKTTQTEKEDTTETKQKIWTEVLKVNGQKLTFRLDTSADCHVLPPTTFRKVAQKDAQLWSPAPS